MEEDKPKIGLGLYGHEDELKKLSEFLDSLDSPNCHLQFREEEKKYYLVSSRFSNLASEQIHELAKKLLTTIRASAKMEKGWDFQSITIGRGKTITEHDNTIAIVEEGKDSRSVHLMLPTIKGGTCSVCPPAVIINGVVQTPKDSSSERGKRPSDDFLDPCEEIENGIYDVLSDFALPTSWFSLNRVLGAVESDIGEDVEKKGWTEKGKRVSFYWSATHYDALVKATDELGLDKGRHDKKEFEHKEKNRLEKIQKGKNVNPYPNLMHLPEAQSLIGCVLKKWLQFKRNS